MAQTGSSFLSYQQQQQTSNEPAMQTHDVAQMYHYGEEDASLLDPAILEPGIMPQHHNLQYRRDSYAHGHGIISPADSQGWDTSYQPMLPIDRTANAQHFRHDQGQYATQSNPRAAGSQLLMRSTWPAHDDSTSTPQHTSSDILPSHMPQDSGSSLFVSTKPDELSQVTHDLAQNSALMTDQPYFAAPQAQTPISPQNHQEWMAFAQHEIESRPLTKRMRPSSPPRSLLDIRRDGAIQKKNKRIDIPQERNIQTIDQMIEKTEDEELLKELKAQKRLLRNREAALASRQRKKKHTEDLEKSEKGYMSQINGLEKEVESLALERNNLHRDREILIHRHQDAERVIEAMHMEKRDMIMKHTEETASLRKKVQVLMEQLESASAPTMSAAPSSTGFTDFNAEMEALSMGAHDWDSFILHNDLSSNSLHDLEFSTPHADPRKIHGPDDTTPAPESTAAQASASTSAEKPVASGLLFMLLLCGAFVASQSGATSKINLPAMPPDVQAVAPTVLNSLLADAGSLTQDSLASRNIKLEPLPSHHAQLDPNTADRMSKLHRSLTAPSRQQEIDSAFALTQAQYAALTNSDVLHEDVTDQGSALKRRTLAQALSESLPPQGEHKAAVYTRSLLWDQIPADVVQQFKQLVQTRADQGFSGGRTDNNHHNENN